MLLRFVLRTVHTFTKLESIKIVCKARALIISAFFPKSTTLMIKYFRETGVKNLDQNNTKIIAKWSFAGLIICCLLKISENLEYLIQKNLESSKKVTQNLVHKSLENIIHFLKIRRLQPKQGTHKVSINKIWFNCIMLSYSN